MGTVMNMSNYEIERSSAEVKDCDQVMPAAWNQAVAIMCQIQPFVPMNNLSPKSLRPSHTQESAILLFPMYVTPRKIQLSNLTTH